MVSNSDMNQRLIGDLIKIDKDSEALLKAAMEKLNLTARSYYRLLKVSRTIADLEQKENILKSHIQEALSYRMSI